MQVDCHNFHEAMEILHSTIDSCVFIAFDLEFSGLGVERITQLDNPFLRYEYARTQALEFPPLQFGLALFRQIPEGDAPEFDDDFKGRVKWEVIPFNFLLYPRAVYKDENAFYPLLDRKLTLQASTVHFLLLHGFDFHRCLTSGISWLHKSDEEKVRNYQITNYRPGGPLYNPRLSQEVRAGIKLFITKLSEWMKSVDNQVGSTTSFEFEDWCHIPKSVLIREVEQKHSSAYICILPKCHVLGLTKRISVKLMAGDEAKELHEKDRKNIYMNKMEKRLEDSIGFRSLVDLLVEKQKPICVHNGLLDLTKFLGNFVSDLPERLSAFKRLLRANFPVVFDTRVVAAKLSVNHRWLEETLNGKDGRSIDGLLTSIKMMSDSSWPAKVLVYHHEEWCGSDNYPGNSHEAGYDAIQTGKLMLFLAGVALQKPITAKDMKQLHDHEMIVTWKNKVFLGSCGGYTDIDLEKTASENADEDTERNIEKERNSWLNRTDVVVISGILCEENGFDIPYQNVSSTIENLLKLSAFNAKKSLIRPLNDGRCLLTLKRTPIKPPPRKKRKPNDVDKSVADEQGEERIEETSTGTLDKETKDNRETEVSKEEMEHLVSVACEKGLRIELYRDVIEEERRVTTRFAK